MNALARSLALALVVAAGCGGSGWPDILDVRHVESPSGAPQVTRVRDMGQPLLPARGPYKVTDSDGVAVIGELLLIEGKDLGKQPTVNIGGRGAEVLRRTEGDGIVVRVPQGTPAGAQPIEVVTARGRTKVDFPIRRLALVTLGDRDRVHVLAVTREAAEPVGTPLAVENARLVRFSPDGSTAYVASSTGMGPAHLSVIDMTAAGGPRVAARRELPSRVVVALAASEGAPRLAVVGEREVTFFDVRDPLRPSHHPSWRLPENLVRGRIVAADIDLEGSLFVLLLAEGNRIAAYDIRRPDSPQHLTTVEVMPDARAPIVRDMRFSIDGDTLWIVSGDNIMSVSHGPQPTRLTAVKLMPSPQKRGPRVISVWRTMPVPGATAPLSLTVARGQMVASGTTIRLAPEAAAVFVTGVQSALFKLEGLALAREADAKKAAALWRQVPQPGMLIRTDVNGGGGPLFSTPALLTGVDLTPDSQLLVAVAARVATDKDTLTVEGGVVTTRMFTKTHTPTFLSLGQLKSDLVRPPFRLGEVRIQP
ncbi:MAG: hypothetical protein HY906_09760 [Deltaproteobacteria bacterium]|nr:hypothetical protein [Deltaproteobacteria bacterium]